MTVRIYRPAKSAMQSGRAKTGRWVLEHEPGAARGADPLMGWTSGADTKHQVRLFFSSEDEAVAYAKKRGWMYRVERARERRIRPKAYADNFRTTRVGRWTH